MMSMQHSSAQHSPGAREQEKDTDRRPGKEPSTPLSPTTVLRGEQQGESPVSSPRVGGVDVLDRSDDVMQGQQARRV